MKMIAVFHLTFTLLLKIHLNSFENDTDISNVRRILANSMPSKPNFQSCTKDKIEAAKIFTASSQFLCVMFFVCLNDFAD